MTPFSFDDPDTRARSLTKILVTLGPSTDSPEVMRRLVDCGASLFRLNFSHGEVEEHASRLALVREVERETGVPLGVLGDLPGPKIRVGKVPGAGIELHAGQDVIICADNRDAVDGPVPTLGCNYDGLTDDLRAGERVLINDGAVRMLAVDGDEGWLLCRVTQGGLVTSRKGLNLPDTDLTVPAMTDRDWMFVPWAVEQGLDFLALSFVRRGEDVRALRDDLERRSAMGVSEPTAVEIEQARIPVIAKIETPQAVRNIEEIADVADGLMVARGDLGVEMDIASVPMVQKHLINVAHAFGTPCIVATQMLETMTTAAHPTRAEVSDVANAIVDGADAVMLSAETAVGKHPSLVVNTMRRVALATEGSIKRGDPDARPPARLRHARERVAALAHGAWHMARDVNARLMIIWSQTGGSARLLGRSGMHIPIVAFSSDKRAVRRMTLLHGVYPVLASYVPPHRSEFGAYAMRTVVEMGLGETGDQVVLLGGKPLDNSGSVNTVAIRTIGELREGDVPPPEAAARAAVADGVV